MGFHKHIFPIRMIDAYGERFGTLIEVVTGWANEDYTIGFHKVRNGKAWAATDVYSGMRIVTKPTRRECFEWVEQNKNKISNKMSDLLYYQRVMEFRDLLRAEKERLDG